MKVEFSIDIKEKPGKRPGFVEICYSYSHNPGLIYSSQVPVEFRLLFIEDLKKMQEAMISSALGNSLK